MKLDELRDRAIDVVNACVARGGDPDRDVEALTAKLAYWRAARDAAFAIDVAAASAQPAEQLHQLRRCFAAIGVPFPPEQ